MLETADIDSNTSQGAKSNRRQSGVASADKAT